MTTQPRVERLRSKRNTHTIYWSHLHTRVRTSVGFGTVHRILHRQHPRLERLSDVGRPVWKTRWLRPRLTGAPEASLSARLCSGLPRTSDSLGHPAAWAALAGHIGLVFHIGVTSIIFGTICLSWADGQK